LELKALLIRDWVGPVSGFLWDGASITFGLVNPSTVHDVGLAVEVFEDRVDGIFEGKAFNREHTSLCKRLVLPIARRITRLG
jgi:hypothetical protein